ncbi:MAG: ABC transporter ATP-binding protein [Lapillicoccus sp.]
MTHLLEVRDMRAGYARIEALHGVSLAVGSGEAVCTIGPNGAGKTTLLKAVSGLLPARGGRVLLDGADITRWPAERRARAGVVLVPEGRQVFGALTVRENLELGAYGRRRGAAAEMERTLDLFPVLRERDRQLAGTLSGGQQQQLAIGRALMGRPRVLLLDEPSLGLAPLAVREVTDKLVALAASGTTLVLVEQNATAAFRVASRGYVLDRGVVVIEAGTPALREDPRVQAAYLGMP